MGEVDVGLVQQYDAAFGLVGHQVLDVLFARDRARRVIRVADVDQSGIGVGLGHRLHVV